MPQLFERTSQTVGFSEAMVASRKEKYFSAPLKELKFHDAFMMELFVVAMSIETFANTLAAQRT